MPLDVIAQEANKYFDAQAIVDVLVSAGLTGDMIKLCIEMKNSRELHDTHVLMLGIMDQLEKLNETLHALVTEQT